MTPDGLGLTKGFATSGAEEIATLMPTARLYKAFNQTGLENLGDARGFDRRPVMFVAGDDATNKPKVIDLVGQLGFDVVDAPSGKPQVTRLVEDAGFEAIDVGGLRAARLLEPLAMLWIELARKRGLGPNFTFTLQRKA